MAEQEELEQEEAGEETSTCTHLEFEEANSLGNLIQNSNLAELEKIQKTNSAELKSFSDLMRAKIESDPLKPKIHFMGYSESFKRIRLSMPTDSVTESNDVTMEVYLKDRWYEFSFELKFKEYLEDDSKTIKLVGKLTSLTLEGDCGEKLEDILYALYKKYVKDFGNISLKETFDDLFSKYQQMASGKVIDITSEIQKSIRKA